MRITKQISRNTAALLASNFSNKVVGFLVMLSVARFLGAEQFGLYTFVFAYVGVFGLVTDLGLTTVVSRELSQDEITGRLCLGNAIEVRFFISVVGYLVCVGASLLYHGWSMKTSLIALSALSFLFTPLATIQAVFTARLRLYVTSIVNFCSRLLLLLAVQWLARAGAAVWALIAVEVGLGGTTTIVLWFWSARMLSPNYRPDLRVIRKVIAEGAPLFLTSVFISLYFRIDVFFLEYWIGDRAVGSYAAAYRLTEAVPLAATALTSSLFPVVCQMVHQGNSQLLEKLLRGSQKILLGVALPATAILAWYSVPIMRLVYAGRFDASASALAILGCGFIFTYLNILSSTLMIASNRGRVLMLVTLGMLCLNAILNFLLIPLYGVPGAALTTVLTEVGGSVALLFLTETFHGLTNVLLRLMAPTGAFMMVLWAFGQATPSTMFWSIPLALIVYTLAIRVLGVFEQEEWDHLKRVAF